MDRRKEINASRLMAALGVSFSVISLRHTAGFAVEIRFGLEKKKVEEERALGGGGSVS